MAPTGREPRARERDEIAAVVAVGLAEGLRRLPLDVLDLRSKARHLAFELEDAADPLEVEALGGELLDASELGDVRLGVAAAAAARPGRVEQPASLVDAQRLGVHAGELGGHRDHVHRPVGAVRRRLPGFLAVRWSVSRGHGQTPRCSRGDPSVARASASTAFRCSSLSVSGTATSTVTRRSPALVPDFTPRPFTRNVLPFGVPGGTRRVTAPSSEGTLMSAPRVASAKVTGTFRVRLRPLRPKSGCLATCTTT